MIGKGDDRIGVRFGTVHEARPDDALLIEGADQGEGEGPAHRAASARFAVSARLAWHAPRCACCQPRSAAAVGFARLFLARASGSAPWFRDVVVVTRTAAGADAVRDALAEDALTLARFRLAR